MSICLVDYTVDIGGWAPWIQSVGTILALLIAIWVPAHQHRLDVRREKTNRDADTIAILEMLLALTETAGASIIGLKELSAKIAARGRSCVVPEDVLQMEKKIIGDTPIHQLGDPDVILSVVHFGRSLDHFRLNLTIFVNGDSYQDIQNGAHFRVAPSGGQILAFQDLCDKQMREIETIAEVLAERVNTLKGGRSSR